MSFRKDRKIEISSSYENIFIIFFLEDLVLLKWMHRVIFLKAGKEIIKGFDNIKVDYVGECGKCLLYIIDLYIICIDL